MNFKSAILASFIPFAVFANEVSLTEAEQLQAAEPAPIEFTEPANQVPQATEAINQDSLAAATVTESEFTGNPAIDTLDAGNDENAAVDPNETAIVVSEGTSESQVVAADSTAEENQEADDEKEMSQEEADAELAAATEAVTDSAAADSVLSTMELDMKAAVIPTYSRRIASPYGIRTYRMHRGVDLGLCHGEDRTIVAAFPGKVKLVRNQGRRRGYGKYVILDHGNGLTTLYAHLASWNVKIGDEVQAGDTIGVGGNTGRSFGAHLHFEIKYKGIHIDPTTVFNFQDSTYVNEVAVLDPAALQAVEDEYQKELSKHRYYKVRRGDCLGKIARRYGISVTKLKKLNGLRSNFIRPGQVLKCS